MPSQDEMNSNPPDRNAVTDLEIWITSALVADGSNLEASPAMVWCICNKILSVKVGRPIVRSSSESLITSIDTLRFFRRVGL